MSTIMSPTMVAPTYNQPAQVVDREAYCPTPTCTGEAWTVEPVVGAEQLWRVSSAMGGAYLVASVMPACPWCGQNLLPNSATERAAAQNE